MAKKKEETTQDIVAKMASWCSKKTAPLGNGALAVVIGTEELHALGLEVAHAADELRDIEATKVACRRYCEALVKRLDEITVKG